MKLSKISHAYAQSAEVASLEISFSEADTVFDQAAKNKPSNSNWPFPPSMPLKTEDKKMGQTSDRSGDEKFAHTKNRQHRIAVEQIAKRSGQAEVLANGSAIQNRARDQMEYRISTGTIKEVASLATGNAWFGVMCRDPSAVERNFSLIIVNDFVDGDIDPFFKELGVIECLPTEILVEFDLPPKEMYSAVLPFIRGLEQIAGVNRVDRWGPSDAVCDKGAVLEVVFMLMTKSRAVEKFIREQMIEAVFKSLEAVEREIRCLARWSASGA